MVSDGDILRDMMLTIGRVIQDNLMGMAANFAQSQSKLETCC